MPKPKGKISLQSGFNHRTKKQRESECIRMNSKINGQCITCLKPIKMGDRVKYFPNLKAATHPGCKNP